MQKRAAVIGTGFIGPVHVEGLRRAGIEVAGILGSSPEKSVRAAQQLDIPTAYASLEQLLDDSVDCVHVTSPNQAHYDQAAACLQAGKHVLCEKPLAMNSEESRRLVELAAKSRLAGGVNYNIRYYPLCLEAAEQRKLGVLGDIFHVTGSYTQDWLFHPTDFNWRVLAGQGGPLRAIADIGTHWLDLIYSITGLDVEAVCADLHTVHPVRQSPVGGAETFTNANQAQIARKHEPVRIDTEDFGSVLLRFRGGARGVLYVSQVAAGHKNCLRWEIAGSNQSLAWNSEQPNTLHAGQRDKANQHITRDPSAMQPRAAEFTNYPAGHNEGFPDTFKQLFRDFYRAIEDESYLENPKFPTFADGHREILLCEAILKSAQQQAWITVS